jgi:hypothetical protein
MGTLDPEIESGITYMPNNGAETIAATLRKVIDNHRYERTIVQAALQTYGPQAVAASLQNLLNRQSVSEWNDEKVRSRSAIRLDGRVDEPRWR